MENIKRIAIIAGSGSFPLFIAKAAKANGVDTVAIAVNSEADKEIEHIAGKTYWLGLGEAKKLLDTLAKEDIKYVLMAGKISKVTILRESLHLDEEAKKLLVNVMDRKDDTLLEAVAARLKDFGIEMLDSTTFVKCMMPPKGILTKHRPTAEQLKDAEFGYRIAKQIGGLDIGQSVVVKKRSIVSVEAIEGTDEAIKRAGALVGAGTVVVKVSKPNQDMRFDVPVIGPVTVESLKQARAAVLAIEAEKVLVLEKEKVVEEADKCGIAIIAI